MAATGCDGLNRRSNWRILSSALLDLIWECTTQVHASTQTKCKSHWRREATRVKIDDQAGIQGEIGYFVGVM